MWIVDRFEAGFAVLEHGNLFEYVSRETLPPSCREGSVLRKNKEGLFEIDLAQEEERRKKLHRMQKDVFS